jgi:hypothetical protein
VNKQNKNGAAEAAPFLFIKLPHIGKLKRKIRTGRFSDIEPAVENDERIYKKT